MAKAKKKVVKKTKTQLVPKSNNIFSNPTSLIAFLNQEKNEKLVAPSVDIFVRSVQESLSVLKKDGVTKIINCKEEIKSIKHSKDFSKQEKEKKLVLLNSEIKEAKKVKKVNAPKIKEISKKAARFIKKHYKTEFISQELKDELLAPIETFIKNTQEQIDALRKDGVTKINYCKEEIKSIKRSKDLSKQEKHTKILAIDKEIEAAEKVKKANAPKIKELIKKAESFLKEHYKKDYYSHIVRDVKQRLEFYKGRHKKELDNLKKEHLDRVSVIKDKYKNAKGSESKKSKDFDLEEEQFIYSNRVYEEENTFNKMRAQLKDEKHEAYIGKYQYIDKLRNSHFTISQKLAQKVENKKYVFNVKDFFLSNGLYIAIIVIFLLLCLVGLIRDGKQLLTITNILTIFENSSTRVFFALGVAGLILLGGTDLSIGRMIGLSMTITAMFWHNGVNTIKLFGAEVDFTAVPFFFRLILPLLISIIVCGMFSGISGFFTAKFKMHPFISTLGMQLIIFGFWFYATKGGASGVVMDEFVNVVSPSIEGFPTLILWAAACIAVVWFIWNKTRFGKHMYAVGGNSEAAAVSGISVTKIIILTFVMAGILYGMGGWLEAARMHGSASASYGSGWETDAIAACVVGGISFSGGVGKIGGACFGVIIFTSLTYALTFLGIDTNLQFVIKGIIIIAAVALDCVKYLKKK